MVNESRPPSPEGGLPPAEASSYAQTADRLLALAASIQEPTNAQYYAVTWDKTDWRAVAGVSLATIDATGASRQMIWGQLHQAQYRIVRRHADGTEVGQHFIWCPTLPRAVGSPIVLDEKILAEEHGYTRLSQEHILGQLLNRARDVEDLKILREGMTRYNIVDAARLTGGLNDVLLSVLYQKGFNADAFGEMLEVAGLDPRHAARWDARLQGRLLGQLLGAIAHPLHESGSPDLAVDPVVAAAMLEDALEWNIIPNEHRTVDRILGTLPVYAYPFATELLHEHLANSNHTHVSVIFNWDRLHFIRAYIATVVGRVAQENAGVQSYLGTVTVPISRYPGIRLEAEPELYELVNTLSNLTGTEGVPVSSLRGVARAFDRILANLGGDSEFDLSYQPLRQRCIESVEMLLSPLLRRRVGKSAIGNTLAAESGPDPEP